MDVKPFLEFDITKAGDLKKLEQLEKLSKSLFDVEWIRSNAEEKRNINAIKEVLCDWVQESPPELVRLFLNEANIKLKLTSKGYEMASKWVKMAFNAMMYETVSERSASTEGQSSVAVNSSDKIQSRRDEEFQKWHGKLSPDLKNMLSTMEEYILSLGQGIGFGNLRGYRKYMSQGRIFASVVYIQKKILLYLYLDPAKVTIQEGFTRDVVNANVSGPGAVEVSLSNLADLEKAKPLIKGAYDDLIGKQG
jgi:predicted transport protein